MRALLNTSLWISCRATNGGVFGECPLVLERHFPPAEAGELRSQPDVGFVQRCLAPVALSYSIPLAFLIGILLALRRFSTDGELLAIRAGS